MRRLSTKSGFTLIEILVVVAIIGILVSIVSVNFNEARQQSRDRVRMSDLKQLQLALTLYKSQYGRYPEPGCGYDPTDDVGTVWVTPGPTNGTWGARSCEEYITGLVPEFTAELPRDPVQEDVNNMGFFYSTNRNGTGFKLFVNNENIRVESYDNEFARCPRELCEGTGHCSIDANETTYFIYSLGAECR